MSGDPKFAILEQSGTELGGVTEYRPEISDMTDVNTAGASLGQALVYNGTTWVPSTGVNPVYYYSESTGNSTTTSDDWITKLTYTTPTLSAGSYMIQSTCMGTIDSANKRFGIQTLIDSVLCSQILDSPDRANMYLSHTSFCVKTLASPATITVDVQYGQTDDGGSLTVSNARIFILKVA